MCYSGRRMGVSKPVSTNPIGQFKDEVVGEAKNVVKDTAKQIVSEPKKILESILGSAKDKGDRGIEDVGATSGGTNPAQQTMKQQQLIMKRQMEDKEKASKLLQLHRQRLKEEQEFFARKKQQEDIEEEQEEKQEEEEEKAKVMQLKHERNESIQKKRQLHGRMGSKEQGKRKH